jgi:hypothetical protein
MTTIRTVIVRTRELQGWPPSGTVSIRSLLTHFHPPQSGSVRLLLATAAEWEAIPAKLQFRLRYFTENDSTDDFLNGANDEVYMSAIGVDSAAVVVGPDGNPVLDPITTGRIGDVSADEVCDPWRQNPYSLVEFDLRRPSSWPRSFSVTLLIVEEDNGDLGEAFDELQSQVGGAIKQAAIGAASAAAGAAVGAAIGSVIPGIGTAVGAAVGALAALAYDDIIGAISEGLANDVFTPRTLNIEVADPSQLAHHPDIDKVQFLSVKEHGADYVIEYEWHLA